MFLRDLFESNKKLNYDQQQGIGATSNNQEIDYLGMKCMMKPSTFLKLARNLTNPKQSLQYISDELSKGSPIASPCLTINLQTVNGKIIGKNAKIMSHEGRTRMTAIKNLFGDVLVEVHLLFTPNIRARHLTDQIVAELNQGVTNQDGRYISGPLFLKKI